MDLSRGEKKDLLGRLWLYSKEAKQAFYVSDRPNTVITEIGCVCGSGVGISFFNSIKSFNKDPETSKAKGVAVQLPLTDDLLEGILRSDSDMIDLDSCRYQAALETKVRIEGQKYLKDYRMQQKAKLSAERNEGSAPKEYNTTTFMKGYFNPLRRALEIGDNKSQIADERGYILRYSEGTKFSKDVEEIVRISKLKKLGKDDMLKGIGLYALKIDYYMKQEFENAAKIRNQIEEWRKKNKLEN
jgi:hypothetical protein